jgi:hypothetical protein
MSLNLNTSTLPAALLCEGDVGRHQHFNTPTMEKLQWFERVFTFGLPKTMLPFYIERLEGTIHRIEAKIKHVSEEILSHRLDNKWSVKENIGHLAEVDEIANSRIDQMITGMSPLLPAVFEPKAYHELPIREVLNVFRDSRTRNIKRYKALTPSELQQTSLHPRLKVMMSPVDLAWFDAEHDDHHLVRINEILSVLLSNTTGY